MLLGSLTILAWCLFTHRLPSNWSVVPWKPMVIAVASVLLYQLLFFYSVAEVGVAVGSVVAIATTPLWAAAVAFLLFRKKPSKFWAIATALAIVGVCLINFGGGFQSQTLDWKVLLPVAAGLCYGVEIIAVGKVVEKINPETTMLLEMGLVAILLLPVTFFFPSEWIFTTRGILVSLGLGVVTAGMRLSLLYLWHQVHLTCSSFHISVDRAAHGCRTWNFLSSRKPHHTHGFRHVEPDCICHRLNFRWTREILFVKRGE